MKILEIASKEVGQGEVPLNSNKTKYSTWFGLTGVPWCGIFVSWCYAMAGTPLPNIGFTKGFAGCQTAVAYFLKMKLTTKNPVAADLVFFDWNGDGRYDHVGLFSKWIIVGKTFETIEGNTAIGNDSNGGGVMRRTDRKVTSGTLFVHPKI